MSELPTGTVTLLFTDIEGSTGLLRLLGSDRYHQLLADHRRLLRAAFAEAGGREMDTQGDSFFYAFPRARAAITAAIACQRELAAHPWPEGAALRVRVGLDTAEPTVGTDHYVGLGVHRAARIMASGHGGQVLLSGTTRDLVADELPEGVRLLELGEQQLKDFEHPVRLYQLVAPGLPDAFPPLRVPRAEPEPATLRRFRRFALVSVGGLLLAAIAAAILFATRSGGGVVVQSNSVGVIDPKTNRVVGQIGVGIGPGPLSVGAGSVWVGNRDDRTLTRISVATRAVVHTIPLDSTPTGVAAGKDVIWVAEGAAGALARVQPQFNRVIKTIRNLKGPVRVSGGSSGSVTLGGGDVWVAFGDSTVTRVRAKSDRAVAKGLAGFSPSAIAYGAGAVWIANRTANTVSRFSTTTNQTVSTITVGRGPSGVAVGGGSVWVADGDDGAVSRIDPESRSSTTIAVGHAPSGIAYGADAVWVADSQDGTVSRIDPATGKVVAEIEVGGSPEGVAFGNGLVWVTVDAT
jgi:YVTN family beta-propeller protein